MSLKSVSPSNKRIIFGTTIGVSAMALLRGQLAWFREQGWEVTLVASPDSEAKRAIQRERVSLRGIPMQRNISLAKDIRSALSWIRVVRNVRPGVVNVGTPKASLLGMLAAWLHRVPRRIYTVRGLRLEGSSGFLLKLLWSIERATIAMATDVIAISPSLGTELVRRKLATPQEIWIIGEGSSNGVDTQAIQKRTKQIHRNSRREELGISSDRFVVGYIGRVTREKGFDTLLNALRSEKLTDNVELLIVGSIDDAVLGSAIDDMRDHVHVVHWTDDVWGYLPAIDLLCHPTHREGFGNVVIEAAAAGIPAITTRVTGAVDTLVDRETGFHINVGDVEELVDRINLLAHDQELLKRMGLRAKQRAEEKFEPEDIWSGIEAIANGHSGAAQIKRLDRYMESRVSI